MTEYIPNGGQTYLPVQDNIHIDFLPYTSPAKPNPPLPEVALSQKSIDAGLVLKSQKQHFLPGVTAEMLDWFWANMEKCYYLWAPGSHKRFNWIRSPAQYGIEHSVHMISETTQKGLPVFGGEGVEIHRMVLKEHYPLTSSLEHVICEGIYNGLGELVDYTIHMWEDTTGGCNHITATVANDRVSAPPQFIVEMLKADPNAKIIPNWATDHEDYEASQWPVFLPTLYELWKNHPDPSQNIRCSLRVAKKDGVFDYLEKHLPVTIDFCG